ncbi:tetraspanin-32 isoform X3 [Sturnira hondurensis]|uniref:tetraspanin-32 isoform X3 n=1 Tax=Sturnira hondurensis TaxID=192404 RepID=UPI001879D0C7|nr:tetraspanin-32 isoform X3 [Sturnira hondurensis]
MGPWSRVRVAKCQMLVTSFFVLLLGLLLATVAALSYFGAHFAVIRQVSPEGSPSEALHRWGLPVLRAGVLRPGAGGLLEAPQPHPGGGCRIGHLRPGLRPGSEELAWRPATGAAGHPGHVSVLWEGLPVQPAGRCGGGPVSRRGGHLTGLPAGHSKLPEDTRTHRLHPGQRRPRLHGVRNVAELLPVVRHQLRPQLGPQGDLRPEPPGPWPAALGAQLLQTLPGGAHPSSARRPGPQIGQPPAAPGPLMLYGPPARHLSAHRGTDAPASGPLCPS